MVRILLSSPSTKSSQWRRLLSVPPSSSSAKPTSSPPLSGAAVAKTRAGTGKSTQAPPTSYIKDRGPVSWPSLFLVGVAAASIVAYYNIERERRLESAMGRVVSSESPEGWTPNPDVMAPRKFQLTPWGWFPEDDGFGACKEKKEMERSQIDIGLLCQIYFLKITYFIHAFSPFFFHFCSWKTCHWRSMVTD